MSQIITTELFAQLNSPSCRFVTIDKHHKPIDEATLDTVINRLATAQSEIGLTFELADFTKVVNTINDSIIEATTSVRKSDDDIHHIALSQVCSFAILVKAGILTADLGATFAYTQVNITVEGLTSLIQLKEAGKVIPVGFGTFRHRFIRRPPIKPTVELDAAKGNQTVTEQLSNDCQHFDDTFIHFVITKVTETLDNPAQSSLKQTIHRLTGYHKKYAILLNTHVNRSGVLLHRLKQDNYYELSESGLVAGSADKLIGWMSQCYQEYQLADSSDDNRIEKLKGSYRVSRFRLNLLMAQIQDTGVYAQVVYIPAPATEIFEQAADIPLILDQMMSNTVTLVSEYWQVLTNQSPSLCGVNESDFKHICCDNFSLTQQYKHKLTALATNLDKMAGLVEKHNPVLTRQDHFELLKLLNNDVQQIYAFVENKSNITNTTQTITVPSFNKINEKLSVTTKHVVVSTALHALFAGLEQLACACYARNKPVTLSQKMVNQLKRQSDITLNSVIKSMDDAYTHWLQLMTLLRNEELRNEKLRNEELPNEALRNEELPNEGQSDEERLNKNMPVELKSNVVNEVAVA